MLFPVFCMFFKTTIILPPPFNGTFFNSICSIQIRQAPITQKRIAQRQKVRCAFPCFLTPSVVTYPQRTVRRPHVLLVQESGWMIGPFSCAFNVPQNRRSSTSPSARPKLSVIGGAQTTSMPPSKARMANCRSASTDPRRRMQRLKVSGCVPPLGRRR